MALIVKNIKLACFVLAGLVLLLNLVLNLAFASREAYYYYEVEGMEEANTVRNTYEYMA